MSEKIKVAIECVKALQTVDIEDMSGMLDEFERKHGTVDDNVRSFIDVCVGLAMNEKCKELKKSMGGGK